MPIKHESGDADQSQIEVMQGQWKIHQGAGNIFTAGIATCIGISAYDTVEKRALLAHFDNSSLRNGVLDGMAKAISDNFSAPPQTRIWLGGGNILDPELAAERDSFWDIEDVKIANDETGMFRWRTLEVIDWAVSQGATLRTSWLQGAVTFLDYSLDVDTGEEQITAKPYN